MSGPSSVDIVSPADAGIVLVVSPHDDDGIVGCGGFLANLPVPPVVVIASDGRLGYHSVAERDGFAEQREREALTAYGRVGVPPGRIRFLRYPDMSARNYQSWETPTGQPGAYQEIFRVIRDYRPSTVFLPSELDFHPDHKVIAEAGLVACVQAGETLMPELGPPATIRRIYAYQVWESLPGPIAAYPLDARTAAIKRSAIAAFASQAAAFARMERLGTLRYDEEHFAPVRALDGA
jgi:LmbE family N-acetylglucosaminyl deacetylase